MGRIVKLSEKVINQIAAGEVVERPVAVVKELVENALDAESKRIEVEFRQGGKALIRVTDDGYGMSPEDARQALERHATSKINRVEDILRISSFGFRGEALPSIASVSRFTLRSRTRDATDGTEIQVVNGHVRDPSACGMPQGTSVEVAQLFSTVPARRKFLKTDRTEASHIIQICRYLALAHPEVAFTLIEDGRVLFQSPPAPSLLHRVREIFGKQMASQLMPIDYSEGPYRLRGLIGKPGMGRSTRADLVCYVNLRPVDSRTLHYALIESYHTYIPKGRYPIAFLFLSMPSDGVDVNVHPAKREVRFREEGSIRRFAMEGVISALRKASEAKLVRMESVASLPPENNTPAIPKPQIPAARSPAMNAGSALPFSTAPIQRSERVDLPPANPSKPVETVDPAANPGWRYIGRAQDRYLIFDRPGGLVLLHPRAARERIQFEKILKRLGSGEVKRQRMLLPVMMELDPLSVRALEDNRKRFAHWGFEVEPFGRNVFRLTEVPQWFEPDEGEAFLRDFLHLLEERGWKREDEQAVQRTVAQLAARRLARSPHSADNPQLLVQQLLSCEEPLSDTEGRPTFVELRESELARKFGL